MWTYEQALRFLDRFADNERRSLDPETARVAFSLDEFERYLEFIGSPHRATQFLHIAGTKGKGSTALFLSSIMRCAGYKTGLYTSPHIFSYCERIRVNGTQIPEAEFAALFETLADSLARFAPRPQRVFPTVFELLTAAAFVHFAISKVDIGIMETGLGGRLDSTNVVTPILAIITSLGRDHVKVLGHDLQSIAREKAGIIKQNVSLVLSAQSAQAEAEAVPIVMEIARMQGAPVVRPADLVHATQRAISERGQQFVFGQCAGQSGREASEIVLETSALNVAQEDNLSTVLAAVACLRKQGFRISDESVQRGVRECQLPGRTELVMLPARDAQEQRTLILDGAHCQISARALSRTLDLLYPLRKRLFLFAILNDKEIDDVIEELAPVCRTGRQGDARVRFIVFDSQNPRACPAVTLAERIESRGISVRVAGSPQSALDLALREAEAEEIIVAAGSMYNIAPLKEALKKYSCVV
jgi:dihydrofolate synthase/folylpolyglutamate synthase